MSPDQARSLGIEREKLLNDLESIRRYGETHPGVLVQAWFENLPSARVVALLGGHGNDTYERDLKAMVMYPDQLDVRHLDRTPGELDRIRAEVTELVKDRFVQIGLRQGILVVACGQTRPNWLDCSTNAMAAWSTSQSGAFRTRMHMRRG